MENLHDASFGARLGAFLIDVIAVGGAWTFGSFIFLVIIVPSMPRHSGADGISPEDAGVAVFSMFWLLNLAYVAASWSPILGRQSLGKQVFHLRVVRDSE